MLKRVHVSQYRSCSDVTLDDLGAVTALVGRNAAGKSNLLKSLATLGRNATSATGGDWREAPHLRPARSNAVRPESLAFEATVAIGDAVYEYTMAAYVDLVKRGRDVAPGLSLTERLRVRQGKVTTDVFSRDGDTLTVSTGEAELKIGRTVPALAAASSVLPASNPVLGLTEPLRRFLSGIRYYPMDEPVDSTDRQWIDEREYQAWLAHYTETGGIGRSVAAQLLHLHKTRPDRVALVESKIGPDGLGLIDKIIVQELPRPKGGDMPVLHVVVFQIPAGDFPPMPYASLSHGTRRMLRLVIAMAFGDSTVMLVEHPEDGVHRGLLGKLTGMLTTWDGDGQVVLATHSDDLMNGLGPADIRFVAMGEAGTTVRRLTKGEMKGATTYMSSSRNGGTLAEFLHSIED